MSRADVPRIVGSLVVVASLASLMSCTKTVQLTGDQVLIEALAPDVPIIYVNFSCGADTSIGFFDSNAPGKKPAWAFMRHPGGPKNQISWVVAQNAQPVTINSIGDKPGQGSFPIDVDPIEHGGAPGVPFKAKVKNNAGDPPNPGEDYRDKGYAYSIGLTCTPASGPPIHLVVDPEMIVRKP